MSERTVSAELTFRYNKYCNAVFDFLSLLNNNCKKDTNIDQDIFFQKYKVEINDHFQVEEILDIDISIKKVSDKCIAVDLWGWWGSVSSAWEYLSNYLIENLCLTKYFAAEDCGKTGTISVELHEKKKKRFETIEDEKILDEIIESKGCLLDILKDAYSNGLILQKGNEDLIANIIKFCKYEKLIDYSWTPDLEQEKKDILKWQDKSIDQIWMNGGNNVNVQTAKGEYLVNEMLKSPNWKYLLVDLCNQPVDVDFNSVDIYGESAIDIIKRRNLQNTNTIKKLVSWGILKLKK